MIQIMTAREERLQFHLEDDWKTAQVLQCTDKSKGKLMLLNKTWKLIMVNRDRVTWMSAIVA